MCSTVVICRRTTSTAFAYGRTFVTASTALRILTAEIISIARVIFPVERTPFIRRCISFVEAIENVELRNPSYEPRNASTRIFVTRVPYVMTRLSYIVNRLLNSSTRPLSVFSTSSDNSRFSRIAVSASSPSVWRYERKSFSHSRILSAGTVSRCPRESA